MDRQYQWNHTIYGILRQPYFTENGVFEFQSCCGMYQKFIPFHSQDSTVWVYHILFIHLSADEHLSCFQSLANMNNVAVSTGV